MKQTILRVCGWLSLIGGVVLAIRTIQVARSLDFAGSGIYVLAIAQAFGGIVAWALLSTVADIADKLTPPEPEQPLYRLPPQVSENPPPRRSTTAFKEDETEDERLDRVYGKVKRPEDQ